MPLTHLLFLALVTGGLVQAQIQSLGLCNLLGSPNISLTPFLWTIPCARMCLSTSSQFHNKCLFQMLVAFPHGLDGNDKK